MAAWYGGGRLALAEAADGAKLCLERGFKDAQNEVFGFIVHGELLSMGLRRSIEQVSRSVNTY
jgi:hypothetical protein